MKFLELVEEFKKKIEEVENLGKRIGKILCDALRPIIPDITYSLGWYEAGIDTICLWSDSRSISAKRAMEDIPLHSIIRETLPELHYYLDMPYGIYLSKDEAEEVRRILSNLKNLEVSGE